MKQKSKNGRNVPNLRFPQFTVEWETKKLGDVMEFKVTNSYSRENLNYEVGTVKNIHYGDIHTKFQTLFDITKEIVPFINEEINIGRISDANYCRAGDVIFADASEDLNDVGKSIEIVNVNGEKLLSGLHTLLARPKTSIFHIGFNGYLFKSNFVKSQIQKESQGSKVLSINVGRISKIHLSFPSVEEQNKIASFLTLMDERIQTQSKIIRELQSLKISLQRRIFTQELKLSESHKQWHTVKLREVGSFFSGGTPLTTKKQYYEGDIPFIKSGEINSNNTEQFISEEGLKNSSAKLIESGDLIYALYGATSGEVGISKIDGAINQAVLCIRTNMDNIFLFNFLVFNKERILKTYLQGGQGNLSAEIIKSLEVPYPHIQAQQKIASIFSAIDDKIVLERELLSQFISQKQYFLQNLFI